MLMARRATRWKVAPPMGTTEADFRPRFRLTSPKASIPLPLERAEQAMVFDWLRLQENFWPDLRFVHASSNGAFMTKKTAALMQRMGVKRGVPDIQLPFARAGYLGCAIEMKRRPNKLTPEQEVWLDKLASEGWQCHVCYSATEAIEVLKAYVSADE